LVRVTAVAASVTGAALEIGAGPVLEIAAAAPVLAAAEPIALATGISRAAAGETAMPLAEEPEVTTDRARVATAVAVPPALDLAVEEDSVVAAVAVVAAAGAGRRTDRERGI
jgi:hypothetical protein